MLANCGLRTSAQGISRPWPPRVRNAPRQPQADRGDALNILVQHLRMSGLNKRGNHPHGGQLWHNKRIRLLPVRNSDLQNHAATLSSFRISALRCPAKTQEMRWTLRTGEGGKANSGRRHWPSIGGASALAQLNCCLPQLKCCLPTAMPSRPQGQPADHRPSSGAKGGGG